MTVQTTPPVIQDPKLVELGINVIRGLAMDAPERANSGHTGTAMALAPLAHVLWTRIMRYDPRDPHWPDRDRFVLSCGHACILQYAMLHLTGYDLSLEDLRQFRQWGSRTPGHPEAGHTAGLEVTTGPLGQGFGDAVGLALAERWLRTTFGTEVCDHRTFVIASDGCIMEGISHEAASWPATSGWAGSWPSTTTTTSRSTGRPSSPTATTPWAASRPTAGGSATSARWPTTSTSSRPRSARLSTTRPTGPTPSPTCSSCAATSGGPRPT